MDSELALKCFDLVKIGTDVGIERQIGGLLRTLKHWCETHVFTVPISHLVKDRKRP